LSFLSFLSFFSFFSFFADFGDDEPMTSDASTRASLRLPPPAALCARR
jgi:hypothetical protein